MNRVSRTFLSAILAELVRAIMVLSVFFLALTPLSVGAYTPSATLVLTNPAFASFCGATGEPGAGDENCGLCLLNHAVSTIPPLPAINTIRLASIILPAPEVSVPVFASPLFVSPQTRAPPAFLAI
ncbi:MAG: hypothetical protein KDJ19_10010 [Hyphomicrobiaceae bacterium]|nr:hypothetical protein [Hyphomicrobiaceae bacterium]MCC0024322.1 hypothetical protein [Hyphomicrobiaceae bacterium]